jgi:hypothetical protein
MSGQTERLDKTEEIERLKEQAEFNRSVKLNQARDRVCEAAVEWWRVGDGPGYWVALADLRHVVKQLAELEEQCTNP